MLFQTDRVDGRSHEMTLHTAFFLFHAARDTNIFAIGYFNKIFRHAIPFPNGPRVCANLACVWRQSLAT